MMTDSGWNDYVEPPEPETMDIPPINLDDILVPEPVTATFIAGTNYPTGTVVEHEGKLYVALTTAAVAPTPGGGSIWRDLSVPDEADQAEAELAENDLAEELL